MEFTFAVVDEEVGGFGRFAVDNDAVETGALQFRSPVAAGLCFAVAAAQR